MDAEIHFENISGEAVTLTTNGIQELKTQAGQVKALFRERRQSIAAMYHSGNRVVVDIDYEATLARDLPNGLKAGEKITLKGQSIFTFKGRKIIDLKDISG